MVLPVNSTVEDAMAASGIPAEVLGFAVLSGKIAERDYVLCDGDEVTLYPAIVGG